MLDYQVQRPEVASMPNSDDVRDLIGSEFPKGSGVNLEVNISADDTNRVSVVLSASRREIWLAPPLVKQLIVIKHRVPTDVVAAIITLKTARQPFRLWVVDIVNQEATLGHFAVN